MDALTQEDQVSILEDGQTPVVLDGSKIRVIERVESQRGEEEGEKPAKPEWGYAFDLGLRQTIPGVEGAMRAFVCSAQLDTGGGASMLFVHESDLRMRGKRLYITCPLCKTRHRAVSVAEGLGDHQFGYSSGHQDELAAFTDHETLLLNELELRKRAVECQASRAAGGAS